LGQVGDFNSQENEIEERDNIINLGNENNEVDYSQKSSSFLSVPISEEEKFSNKESTISVTDKS